MNQHHHGGAALLQRLATYGDPALFQDVADATGTDRHQAISLTVDAARRVVDVRILDIDRLRRRDAFTDSLQEAFGAADGARALASLDRSGKAEEFLARAEETLAGRRPAQAPPPPDVSREACAARRTARGTGVRRLEPPAPVTSDNGHLTVQRGLDGRLIWVDVDEEWLNGAAPHHLRQAIMQALAFGTEI